MSKIEKIFIIAPIYGDEAERNLEKYASKIREFNVEAVTPSLELDTEFESHDKIIRKIISELVKCDIAVSFGEWFEHEECLTLTKVARIINIPILHSSRLDEQTLNALGND